MGNLLKQSDAVLYEKAIISEKWVIIRGEIENDSTLEYLRNVVGIVQAFVDTGAEAVLDLLTFTLMSPSYWSDNVFMGEFNPYIHVKILSMEDNTIWLHTRGMIKFGRPDIGIKSVSKDDTEDAVQVINQYFIDYEIVEDEADKVNKSKYTWRTYGKKNNNNAWHFINSF